MFSELTQEGMIGSGDGVCGDEMMDGGWVLYLSDMYMLTCEVSDRSESGIGRKEGQGTGVLNSFSSRCEHCTPVVRAAHDGARRAAKAVHEGGALGSSDATAIVGNAAARRRGR